LKNVKNNLYAFAVGDVFAINFSYKISYHKLKLNAWVATFLWDKKLPSSGPTHFNFFEDLAKSEYT
jgi:hypothetical protein